MPTLENRPPRKRRGAAPKRRTAQREADLVDIARLWREGLTHFQIAEWLKLNRPYRLTRQQVTYDLKDLMERWTKQAAASIDQRKGEQVARIDAVEAQAWAAWRKSIGEVTEVEQEQVEGEKDEKGKPRSRAKVRKSMSHGDPRYLHIVNQCIEARNKLLGLNRAKIEVTGADGGPVEVEGVSGEFDMAAIDKFLASQYGKRNESQPNPTGQG